MKQAIRDGLLFAAIALVALAIVVRHTFDVVPYQWNYLP